MKILKNVRILRNNFLNNVDIEIENGKIVNIEESINKSNAAIIDGENLLALPGLIDPHVHFDDPGYTLREDFETGTKSAIAGGVTTIIDMPCTSIPPVINSYSFKEKYDIVSKKAFCDYSFWGGMTPKQITNGTYKKDLLEQKENGIVGIKFYTISGMEEYPKMNIEHLYLAFKELKELNLISAVHAEDYDLVNFFTNLLISSDCTMPICWTKGRVYEAEAIAIYKVACLAREAGNKLHIVHLTSKDGLDAIIKFKKQNIDITTETCPHYLAFSESDLEKIGPILKTAPPVRKNEDIEYLWDGIKEEYIDFIASDHAGGVFPEEKNKEKIWDNYSGIPGTQLILPAIITLGYHKRGIPLQLIQKIISENAAKRYGLRDKGKIDIGFDADFALIDLDEEWVFSSSMLYCKNKYSPFDGFAMKGKVKKTILRGELIYDDSIGFILQEPSGIFISRF